jgi:hypothetical protein
MSAAAAKPLKVSCSSMLLITVTYAPLLKRSGTTQVSALPQFLIATPGVVALTASAACPRLNLGAGFGAGAQKGAAPLLTCGPGSMRSA